MTTYIVTNDAQLQAALAAQQDGDVINVAAGTYTTAVVVTADITINGAKAGQAGDSNSRGFGESVFKGGIQLNGNGATIDGVQVLAGGVGTNGSGAVEVNADNVSLTNVYFLGDSANADPAIADDFAVAVDSGVTGFSLTDNAIRGWAVGVYVTTGATGLASDNLFDQNGNGINTESVLFDISANHFQHSVGGDITVFATGLNDDVQTFVDADNTFQRDDQARSVAIFAMTPGSHTTGSSFGDYFDAGYGPAGDYAFSGADGADRAWGAAGNDTLGGDAGNDTMYGQDGDDSLLGGDGDDTLNGENNNDVLEGGAGSNQLNGGSGTDTASYANAAAGVTVDLGRVAAQDTGAGTDSFSSIENLLGSAFADSLVGDSANNLIDGADGDDTLNGSQGDDTVNGGAGVDHVIGGNGADLLSGGTGDDVLDGKVGADVLNGDAGRDALNGGGDNDQLNGGDNFDTLFGSTGNDTLDGGTGNDILIGGEGNDTLTGGDGSDTASYVDAGAAVTVTLANQDSDGRAFALFNPGPQGQDTGGAGIDLLSGIENLTGSRFGDTLTGDANANVLKGEAGEDTLSGAAGNDILDGGKQDDHLDGGAGKDNLDGAGGRDWLDGGVDDDVLTGGAKSDVFFFGESHDDDTVTDFTAGSGKNHDVIIYGNGAFADFADVMDHAIQLGNDVIIVEDNGDTVRLHDVLAGDLASDNFSFVS